MVRFFIIIATVWRFGLDDIIFSIIDHPLANTWRRLTAWRHTRAPAVRLRLALEGLGPIFVKFGQVLSTRRDILRADFADELAKLQDQVPPEDDAVIKQALQKAYGCAIEEIFSEFDAQAVGSASVAQVHRACLAVNGQEVAVKILRPGIGVRIRRDLRLLNAFAVLAQTLLKDSRRLKPRAIVAQFARHLQAETNLLHEAANCAQLRRNTEGAAMLHVPAVYWQWCSETVMVMEFLSGVPISRIDELGGHINKHLLARAGIDMFFTQVFRDNFFHADMHPGNVHVGADGHFILLDYGIVGQLTDFDKEYLLRNFLAFFNRDYRAVAEMHVAAGWVPADVNLQDFEAELRAVCEPIFAQPLKNISFGRFLLKMFQTARRFNLEVQPQLILLQKTLLNVEGMGRELDPEINMWETAKPVLEHWAKQERSPQQVLALLRKQVPDWLALLQDAPVVMRLLLARRQSNLRDMSAQRRRLRQLRIWRGIAIGAIAVLLAALWRLPLL